MQTDHTKKERRQTGIYCILNTVNGKMYVGSAAASFGFRWRKHLYELERIKHGSLKLQNAVNKHGVENFKFIILEVCESQMCIEREQYYIDTLNPEYNVRSVASSNLGIKLSKQTIKKRTESRTKYIYLVQTPQREIVEVIGPFQYSQRLGLDVRCFTQTLTNNKNHKGYVVLHRRDIGEPAPENIQLREVVLKGSKEWTKSKSLQRSKFQYTIQLPTSEIVKTRSLTSFAKQHKLSDTVLGYTLWGQNAKGVACKSYRGYKVLSKTPLDKNGNLVEDQAIHRDPSIDSRISIRKTEQWKKEHGFKYSYQVQTPTGGVVEVDSISHLAKQHNLEPSQLYKTYEAVYSKSGEPVRHKGFRIISKTPITN